MDIWNKMFEGIQNQWGPCSLPIYPKVFDINRMLEQSHSQSLLSFIKEYLIKHDNLSYLYALNAACMEVIEESVRQIEYTGEESSQDLENIVAINLEPFPEIVSIIDIEALKKEISEVAEDNHWSDEGLVTPLNMCILGQLSYHIQKTLENSECNPLDKAHAYMCSLTIGNYRRFDYESFTYQLSRKVELNETINNFIPYLQQEASNRESLYAVRNWYEAEVLRLIQWTDIGNIGEQVKEFCNSIQINHPTPINSDFDESVWKYLNVPFALFRSDFALRSLHDKLVKYLYACQLWLQNCPLEAPEGTTDLLHLSKMMISAIYLFGVYRLGINEYDNATIEDAGSYLQTYQLPDAAFFHESFPYFNYLELNAMAAHALWISEAHGWKRSVQRICDWIIGELDIYGVWYPVRFDQTGYTTCLMLDTIELLEENSRITFDIPAHKKKTKCISDSSAEHSIIYNVVNNISIETMQNIFGETKATKTKKKSKRETSKQSQDSEDTSQKYTKWKDRDQATILLDYSKNTLVIYFVHKDCKPGKLPINSGDRLHKLLPFMKDREVKAMDIVDYFDGSDKADKIIRDCNISLNRKIGQIGLCYWEGFVEILGRTKRGIYQSFVPIKTKEEYERDYIKSQERCEYDKYENQNNDFKDD